jgi:general secretion pathway protein K
MRYRDKFRLSAGEDRGFAIVVVLWIAGILAVMASSLSVSVRTEVRAAANLVESAKAEALADGGITLAMVDLMAARRAQVHVRRFPLDGSPVSCRIAGEGHLTVAVLDEAAKIDVNAAGLPLLQALLMGLGEPPETAARLAEAIFDFRDADEDRLPHGAEAAEYRAAGLGWLPKNSRMHSLGELAQVYGMTPEHLARMRPYLGTHSGLPGIDANLASPTLIGIIRAGLQSAQAVNGGFSELHAQVALPAVFISASRRTTFQVLAEAHTATGAVYRREAVISLGTRQNPHPTLLRWTRGGGLPLLEESRGGEISPPC